MAQLRNITDETLHVPLADKDVAPDDILEVSDPTFLAHEWPETVWFVVEAPPRPVDAAFDPSSATVDQVNAYLADANGEERDRVLAAERAGKARVGVLGTDSNDNNDEEQS